MTEEIPTEEIPLYQPKADVAEKEQAAGYSREADVSDAVSVYGPWWMHHQPPGRLTRAIALHLARLVPVRLMSTTGAPMSDDDVSFAVLEQVGHLRRVASRTTSVAVRYISLERHDLVHGQLIPAATRWSIAAQRDALRRTLAVVEPASDSIPTEAADVLSMAAGVIVTSEAGRQCLCDSGVPADQVFVIDAEALYEPEPVVVPLTIRQEATARVDLVRLASAGRLGIPHGTGFVPPGRRFYALGEWGQRGGLAELLRAFTVAFRPGDDATLEIAVDERQAFPGYPTAARAWEVAGRSAGWTAEAVQKHVRVLRRTAMRPADVLAMHERNNIYVETMANPPALTDAVDAFAGGNALVERPEAEGLRSAYPWVGGHWRVLDEDALVSAMRDARPPDDRICRRRNPDRNAGQELLHVMQMSDIPVKHLTQGGVLP